MILQYFLYENYMKVKIALIWWGNIGMLMPAQLYNKLTWMKYFLYLLLFPTHQKHISTNDETLYNVTIRGLWMCIWIKLVLWYVFVNKIVDATVLKRDKQLFMYIVHNNQTLCSNLAYSWSQRLKWSHITRTPRRKSG